MDMNSKVENTCTENAMVPGSTPTSPATRPEKRRCLSSPTDAPEPPAPSEPTNGIEYDTPTPAPMHPIAPILTNPESDFVEVRSVGCQCRPLEEEEQNVCICVVCKVKEVEYVFVPCGHRKVCYDCLEEKTCKLSSNRLPLRALPGRARKCPICRTPVRELVVVYE